MDRRSKVCLACAWVFWLLAGVTLFVGVLEQYLFYSALIPPNPYEWLSRAGEPRLWGLLWGWSFAVLEEVLYPAIVLATVGTACRLLGDIQVRLAVRRVAFR